MSNAITKVLIIEDSAEVVDARHPGIQSTLA